MASVISFFRSPGLSPHIENDKLKAVEKLCSVRIKSMQTESTFYVETQSTLTEKEILQIKWVLAPVLNPDLLTNATRLAPSQKLDKNSIFIEIGPR